MRGKKTALIVDDDNLSGRVLDAVLLSSGYQIERAESGGAALTLAAEHCFDVIVAGYWIEDMNGPDLVGRLRERCPGSFIIGTSQEGRGAEFIKAGADGFLRKPFGFRELDSLLWGASS